MVTQHELNMLYNVYGKNKTTSNENKIEDLFGKC